MEASVKAVFPLEEIIDAIGIKALLLIAMF